MEILWQTLLFSVYTQLAFAPSHWECHPRPKHTVRTRMYGYCLLYDRKPNNSRYSN